MDLPKFIMRAKLDYLRLADVLARIATAHNISQADAVAVLCVSIRRAENKPRLFDLQDFDPLHSLSAPREVDLNQLLQALENATASQVGFLREELESVLDCSLLTEQEQTVLNAEAPPSQTSARSEAKKDEFIYQLLRVHYGADVANNPRRHIAEITATGARGCNGEISRAFELAGITPNITGRTLENWTKPHRQTDR
ncbi:hypothetical protein KRX11_01075 [Pasteurellaceae bacterium TAE3-ERU1]|nr:hypothetical protein [Pasteurellaceae bacterium TAE3-ERU1]